MNNSDTTFINNSETEDIEESSKEEETLRDIDWEHEQYIQKLYDKGEIIDY